MAEIQVEVRPGEFAPFEIKGEKPNYVEMKQIEKLVKDIERSENNSISVASSDSNQFDTETGIKDSALRRQLSGAETSKEEENVLGRYGFQEGDYIRDSRGNLALTPQGALLLDIKTDKPIMIDESGFSLADLQDFVGVAGEEIVGGVAGAIAGTRQAEIFRRFKACLQPRQPECFTALEKGQKRFTPAIRNG